LPPPFDFSFSGTLPIYPIPPGFLQCQHLPLKSLLKGALWGTGLSLVDFLVLFFFLISTGHNFSFPFSVPYNPPHEDPNSNKAHFSDKSFSVMDRGPLLRFFFFRVSIFYCVAPPNFLLCETLRPILFHRVDTLPLPPS